jgi:hypothetical protein
MASKAQLYSNVVTEFLRFFIKMGAKETDLFNKIAKDLQNVQHQLKPNQIVEIIKSLSIIRLHHPTIFKFLSSKIAQFISQYRKDLSDVLYYYSTILNCSIRII